MTLTLIAIFLMLMTAMPATAGENDYFVTVKDGLSNGSINSIMQDDKGRLWLSTWDGVNVYNGRTVKVYKNDPFDEHSLLDNVVRYIVQEDERYFWIISEWGVSRLDTSTDKFSRYDLANDKGNPFSSSSVSLTIDPAGRIFCSFKGWGVAFYDSVSDKMRPFNISGLNTSSVIKVVGAGEGSIILITTDGSAVRINYEMVPGGDIRVYNLEELLPDTAGLYEVASNDRDVCLIGRNYVYRYSRSKGEIIDSIAFNGTVSYSSVAPDGVLYFVSDRSDIYRIDFNERVASKVSELCRDNLMSFCFGTQGIVWLAVDGVGLEACCPETSALRKLESSSLFGNSGGAVSSIVQADNGEIFLSVLGSGLYKLKPDGTPISPVGQSFQDDYLFSMIKGPSGNLFIGGRNVIEMYNPESGLRRTVKSFSSIPPVVAYCMYYDNESSTLWMGTLDSGVYELKLEVVGKNCRVVSEKRYYHDRSNNGSLGSDNVMHIAPGYGHTLWIGTLGGGLNLLDTETGAVTRFNSPELPSDNARYALQDAPGSVWVGTSYGLAHGTMDDGGKWTFKSYNENNGLSNNTIHSILIDDAGRLWMGTNKGISIFEPRSERFTNQETSGNLQGWEFYIHSCLMAENGEMYFGGMNGLNHFFPDKVKARDFCPGIMLEYLSVRLGDFRPLKGDERVVLDYDENFFNIGFSAIEYINNANCDFAYKLDGFAEDWVTVSSGIPATFTNVPPGRYKFRVKSTNGDKVWCENGQDIDIIVRRPWYQTVWAYLFYALTAVLIWLGYRRGRKARREQKALLAREAEEKKKQKENYEAKLTFFTNIAHEFGTPLTLISFSGEQLATSLIPSSKGVKYVKIINDNASRMQRLIQELLEFRKVETGHYQPDYTRIDPVSKLQLILDDFSEIGNEHDIKLNLKLPETAVEFICDAPALEKIFVNLVSNAYKYTPDGGSVDIEIAMENSDLHMVVTNTSKGLSREKLEHVFDRFVILDNLEQQMAKGKKIRNGVGMALVHSLVRTLGGRIDVDSVMEKSVTFELFIPSAPETLVREKEIGEEAVGHEYSASIEDSPEIISHEAAQEDNFRCTVMIVDDEKQICDMVAEILGTRYNVIKTNNGLEALEVLGKRTVDLVITDINMPGMNGIELIKRLKSEELTKSVPVVFLAFRNDVEDEVTSYNLGSEAFISKPFVPLQLSAVVDSVLKRRNSLKTYYTSSISDTEIFDGKMMRSKDKEFMTSVVGIIEGRISDDLSPAELASGLCVSEMTLYRKLKALSGKTPGEFIRTIKLKKAATLLRTTTMTVQEIMFDCGFNNKSWFYRKFSETYGMSPKEYRMAKTE